MMVHGVKACAKPKNPRSIPRAYKMEEENPTLSSYPPILYPCTHAYTHMLARTHMLTRIHTQSNR